MHRDQTIKVLDLPNIVKKDLCVGCGFCTIPLDKKKSNAKIEMKWSEESEIWTPIILTKPKNIDERRICPGKIINMPILSKQLYGKQPNDSMVGSYINIKAGYATDEKIRLNSASGGITTAILAYLFSTNKIDIAYTAAGLSPYKGKGIIAKNINDLHQTSGSHYHPINYGESLRKLVDSNKRFALVGLPCEIAALQKIMLYRQDIKENCVLIIGLFCGGINRFTGIGNYLKGFNVDPKNVKEIDYRNGLWPGQIRLLEKGKKDSISIPRIYKNSRINILRYMISFQGYSMLPRCRICPDQLADFADISVGDPHLDRFKKRKSKGFSAIISRSKKGDSLISDLVNQKIIQTQNLTRNELVMSQGYTLENRRFTQVVLKVAKILKMNSPDITTYDKNNGSLNWHQYIYAFVDLGKIKIRKIKWLRKFYLPIQIFEYIFLTFSIRVILSRIKKIIKNV